MSNDLYQDQIMVHDSKNWTSKVVQSLHPVLTEHGWIRTSTNHYDFSKYINQQKTLIVNLTHIPFDTCDYYIGDAVTPWQEFKLYPEVFGVYAHDFDYEETKPTKAFNCFINRGCATRQSWFYFFVRQQLLDQGHISFWCEDRFNKTSAEDYSEHLFQTYNRDMFSTEHELMRGKIPYKNFKCSIESAIMDSAKSLVIETFFEPNQHICYTEKTWRALQMPRPMLLFSSQYAIRYLRDWGFDMYDDIVDHAYDLEPDKYVRQQMILNQLSSTVEYDPVLFEKRAQHNRNLLKYYQQQWPVKYKSIVDTVIAISNNESLTLRA